MCGRFTVTVSKEDLNGYLEDYFSVGLLDNIQLPRYNVAPTQHVATLIFGKGSFRLGPMTWGILPKYGRGGPIINARAETIFEKLLFKPLFESRRCLIPADGFYEWKRVGSARKPYRIVLKDRGLFLMAGLYLMTDDHHETRARCAIITTEANEKMSLIHARMPVILTPDAGKTWLDPKSEPHELQTLLKPYREDDMEIYPVDEIVNYAMNDTKACILKIEET